MAISDNYVPVKELGNGVTTQFSGSWAMLAEEYARVYLESVATGVQTLQVNPTDYDMIFDDDGFTVTFVSAPSSSYYVVIGREVEQTQDDPYTTSKGFQGAVVENSFDKLTAITQDLQDAVNRSPKAPVGFTEDLTLPFPDAGKALLWNADEDGFENSDDNVNDIVSDATAQAAIATAAASTATTQAGLATAAKTAADADVVLTHADVVLTHADVVLTHADVVLTHADVVSTHADVVSTAASAATATTQASNASASASTASTAATNASTAQTAAEAARDIAKIAGGFGYTYSTNTASSDPGSGVLKFNNATLASATALYISETTVNSQAIAAEIATWDDSTSTVHTKLRLFKQSDPTVFVIFDVTGTITDNGSWDTVTVAYVTGSGSLSNSDVVTIQPLRTGDKGDTGPAGSVTDGDKGDITVSSSGAVWTIDNDVVTYAKMQNISAQYRLLGRSSSGAGDPEEITTTAFALTLLDDADAATARTTLGVTDPPAAATQSDQETATSTTTYVSPGRQQYHPSASKCWIKFNTVTTTTNLASYNVTSLTDNGTGDTTITINVDFSSADYCAVTGLENEGAPGSGRTLAIKNGGQAAGTLRMFSFNSSGTALDYPGNHVSMFGDQ